LVIGLKEKVLPVVKVAGLIVIPAAKIKMAKRNVNLVVVKRARKEQSILDAAQPQHNVKATSAEEIT